MKLQDLLIFCMAHGIELRLIGNKIHYYKPDGKVPPEIIFFVRYYKGELFGRMAKVKLPSLTLISKLMDEEQEFFLNKETKEKSKKEGISAMQAYKILFEKKMLGK